MTQTSHKPTPDNIKSHEHSVDGNVSQVTITTEPITPVQQTVATEVQHKPTPQRRSRGLSLRNKATAVAIALSILPVLAVGTVNYMLSSQETREDAIKAQESLADALGDQIGRFMFERYGDIQVLANLPIVRNPKVRAVTTLQEKQAVLNRFAEIYGVYDSIAVADLAGNTIVQTSGEPVTGLGTRDYFKEVMKTKRPVITPPRKSALTGEYSIFTAAPIIDAVTGKMIGMVRTRIPVKTLERILQTQKTNAPRGNGSATAAEYHVVGGDGKFFVAKEQQQVGKDANSVFPILAQMQSAKKVTSAEEFAEGTKQLLTYAPIAQFKEMPQLNWSVVLTEENEIVFAAQRRLLLTLLFGTAVTALIVSAIAAYLAYRATRPILAAADTVEKLGQGQLDTRIAVQGEDELAKLGSNINHMAGQLQTLLVEQEKATRKQLAAQEEIAHQQTENAEQQKLAKEKFQQRALELLMEVDPVSRGDLTIRANVTEDEIGTIADSYNSTNISAKQII